MDNPRTTATCAKVEKGMKIKEVRVSDGEKYLMHMSLILLGMPKKTVG